jgi:hypothetical protein
MDNEIVGRLLKVSREHIVCIGESETLVGLSNFKSRPKQRGYSPSESELSSIASPMRIFITPRKPWSFFLNFFWSNTWTAKMLSSLTRLEQYCQ